MNTQKIALFCQEGRSDKEYHLQLTPQGDGYVVNYRHGRRGSSLTSGTKTLKPVPHAAALKIYNAIIKEKLAKGYKPGESEGKDYTSLMQQETFTGVLPQLLHAVPEGEESFYLDSSDWMMQQKFDGHRRMVRSGALGEPIHGINRKGLAVPIPKPIAAAIAALPAQHLVLDAESIGERLFVFDLLEYRKSNIRNWPFARRHEQLRELFSGAYTAGAVEVVPVHASTPEKRRAFEALRASGAEGVTFKLASAPYEPGRPASGGSALKVKFWHTASVLVEQVNCGKRSVEISVLDDSGNRVNVGNVSIPVNQTIPHAGAILEVRYLYAYRGGSLIQPSSCGLRDDIDVNECTQDQLVYKTAGELEETMSPTIP